MKVLQRQKKKRDGRQAGWLRQRLQKFASWLSGKKGIHYINGSQTLPPPLNRQEEEEVFSDLLSCEEPVKQSARQLLIEHNLRLVVYIAKKFESTGINIEDLISIGTIGLIKAVNTFSPEKNIKLATYASRCIENEILMYLRKNQNRRREISIDEPLNIDWDGNELLLSDVLGTEPDVVSSGIERESERLMLYQAIAGLEERERSIMELRFGHPQRPGAGDHHPPLRPGRPGGVHPERGGRPDRYLAVLHFSAGKADYPAAAKGTQADEPRKQGRKLIKSDRLKGRYLPNAGKTPAFFAVFTG